MKLPTSNIMKTNLFIHFFAIAHVLIVIFASWVGWDDGLLLTILTILMISTISVQHKYPLDSTFVVGVFACILGYYLGTWGATLIGTFTQIEGIPLRCLCTFIITEVLGWTVYMITRHREIKEKQK